MDQNIIALNLRRLRESKGYTQEEIANMAGISRVAYRSIESGKSIPKVSTLQNIAAGAGFKLQDLFVSVRTMEKVRFRALKKMNSRESILIQVARWLDHFRYLEELLNDSKDYGLQELADKLSSIPAGEDRSRFAAKEARHKLGLSYKDPIRDIAGLLESAGIKVYPLVLASDDFFGLSVAQVEGGPAIIVNVWERISVERWIFSAAHELGHLLLHLDSYNIVESTENMDEEKEADIFASYFLMPEESFNSEWKGTYGLPLVNRVYKVKGIFQVSYKTVLYRLSEQYGNEVWSKFYAAQKAKTGKSLGFKDEPEGLTKDKFQHSPEALRSKEPNSLLPSYFVEDRLARLVRQAIEKDKITMSRGAEILGMNLGSMRELVSSWV
ncbi:MAG: ImmA/IrrE family metallo-endopeptidase [Acidobacteriota bacterium]